MAITMFQRIGCWIYGHHPWVLAGVNVTTEDDGPLRVYLRTWRGNCKRCDRPVPPETEDTLAYTICPAEVEVETTVNMKVEKHGAP